MSLEMNDQNMDALPLEFLNLPMAEHAILDVSQQIMEQRVFVTSHEHNPKGKLANTLQKWKAIHVTNPLPNQEG